jgi:dTMP kinase
VVSDRYLLSSLAYQAEETDRDWVASLARGVRRPDLTVLIDVPISVAAARRQQAGRPIERYDSDGYLARVAENYRRLASAEAATVLVDGAAPPDQVAEAIATAVDQLLQEKS